MLSDPVLSLSPQLTAAIAELCVLVHQGATNLASRYLLEMKRYSYVTPSSFTELIVVYKRLLSEKMRHVLDDCNRLNSGVSKLDSTAESVAKMKAEVLVLLL
jgi:dynein heavy chain